ncbi:hypothetical protein HOE31_00200 [bacterium]|jgi:hypothetical protein|nr:hypothetical protein [bacterium]MBT4121362.1 hypothetical protein [bacterium]MBT4495366.1 hypothetical protein [bacterium]MBT4764109.1 hypothetical protein [bacterium]MBT5401481.1 hypothetical protein [bacterium]
MKLNEEELIKIAKPYFELARDGDWNHALRVVDWVKKLSFDRDDLDLLITAAYIHDIGWSGVAPKGKIDLDEMLILESKANENSSRLITEVLTKLNFTDSDIFNVIRLVTAADTRKGDKDDESIIIDADNLSKLCIEHLQEKYQPKSFMKLINIWKELGWTIKTEKGKELYPKLLADIEKVVNNK